MGTSITMVLQRPRREEILTEVEQEVEEREVM
jgi:hypothetical protein